MGRNLNVPLGLLMKVLLDTHALLWWTLDSDQLSSKAQKICRGFGEEAGLVSAISIWELGIKIKRGRLDIGMPIEVYADRLQRLKDLKILPVTLEIWLKNLELNWDHRDPADRTIVATSLIHQAILLTRDSVIQDAGVVRAVW